MALRGASFIDLHLASVQACLWLLLMSYYRIAVFTGEQSAERDYHLYGGVVLLDCCKLPQLPKPCETKQKSVSKVMLQ